MLIPDARAARRRSRWHSTPRGVVKGVTQPCLILRAGFDMALWRSIPMVRPKPRQCGQAPNGELNENKDAEGTRSVNPVVGFVQLLENACWLVSEMILTRPFPKGSAISMASRNRDRLRVVILIRSWIMRISVGLPFFQRFGGTGLSVRRRAPS